MCPILFLSSLRSRLTAEVEAYRLEGERLYGRFIPGGILLPFGARFIGGTLRRELPVIRDGRVVGWIDENGVHLYQLNHPFMQQGPLG